jgi:hypothetical protein
MTCLKKLMTYVLQGLQLAVPSQYFYSYHKFQPSQILGAMPLGLKRLREPMEINFSIILYDN